MIKAIGNLFSHACHLVQALNYDASSIYYCVKYNLDDGGKCITYYIGTSAVNDNGKKP